MPSNLHMICLGPILAGPQSRVCAPEHDPPGGFVGNEDMGIGAKGYLAVEQSGWYYYQQCFPRLEIEKY